MMQGRDQLQYHRTQTTLIRTDMVSPIVATFDVRGFNRNEGGGRT